MIKLVLATHNGNKVRELTETLSRMSFPAEILSLSDIGFFDEIAEDGTTFEENALIKASVPAKLGYIGIADDSGLCVDALGGLPGIFSARYAGEGASDSEKCDKLLSELCDVPESRRGAKFVCALACVLPEGSSYVIDGAFCVRGECRGTILFSPRGGNGFGYDPLFRPGGYEKSFAELLPDIKNEISHRGEAVRRFAEKAKEVFRC